MVGSDVCVFLTSATDPVVIDEDNELAINFSKLGMGASRLQLTGEMLSEENPATSSYDEVCQYLSTDVTSPNDVWSSSSGKKKKRPKKQKSRPKLDSDVGDSGSPHKGSSDGGEHEGRADGTHHRLSLMESTSVSEDSEVSLMESSLIPCVVLRIPSGDSIQPYTKCKA